MRDNGLKPFGLFEFTPPGLLIMVCGVAFMIFISTRMLPRRNVSVETAKERQDFHSHYELQEHLFQIRIPPTSALVGKTLARSRLGSTLKKI